MGLGFQVRTSMVSGLVLEQAVTGENVVGQCEPAQNGSDLFETSDRKLVQAPVSEASIEAFGASSALVDRLAVRAFHPGTPGGNAGLVCGAGRIRIARVLAGGRWAVDFDPFAGRHSVSSFLLKPPSIRQRFGQHP